MTVQPSRESRRVSFGGLAAIAGGVALLAWMIWWAGPANIAADVRRVGWGLPAIVAIGGLRFLLRAQAWRICLGRAGALPLGDAFAAVVCGDTLGNLTPLGPIVGEPAKAAFVRRQVPLLDAVTALAIENVAYTLSAAAMIAAGTAALLLRFELPAAIRGAGVAAIAATAVLFGGAAWLLWKQPAVISRALGLAPRLRGYTDRMRDIESRVYSFASRRPAAAAGVAAAEAGFHVLGVAEIHLTLWLLSGRTHAPPLLTSFILETTNRLITVAFRFVPLRLGVDEAGTAFFATLLGLDSGIGVAISIVRKLRILTWSAIGAVLLVRAGLAAPAPAAGHRAGTDAKR